MARIDGIVDIDFNRVTNLIGKSYDDNAAAAKAAGRAYETASINLQLAEASGNLAAKNEAQIESNKAETLMMAIMSAAKKAHDMMMELMRMFRS